jgi:hypothetical protein
VSVRSVYHSHPGSDVKKKKGRLTTALKIRLMSRPN